MRFRKTVDIFPEEVRDKILFLDYNDSNIDEKD